MPRRPISEALLALLEEHLRSDGIGRANPRNRPARQAMVECLRRLARCDPRKADRVDAVLRALKEADTR
jgi:hypothetical protein